MVVEPAKQDLLGTKTQELLERLAILEQAVQLGVDLDVDLGNETAADNLPEEAKNQVLAAILNVAGTDVDDRASNTLCRTDDNVVVLSHLERVEPLLGGLVEYTLVNCVWDRVVDELGEDKAVWGVSVHYS